MFANLHGTAGGAARRGNALAGGAARWLCLAASPAFASMALATAFSGAPEMGCSMGEEASPLGGMAAMYLLMSIFHLAPWLGLMSVRSSANK
jgi:hypothetical protein